MKLLEKYPTRRLPESNTLFKVGEKVGFWPFGVGEGTVYHGTILEVILELRPGRLPLYKIETNDSVSGILGVTYFVLESSIYSLKPF